MHPDPARVAALRSMEAPVRWCELQQFVGAANWLRSHIPNYATIMEPLQDILNEGLRRLPPRTKKPASTFALSNVGWTTVHAAAYRRVRRDLGGKSVV